MFSFVLENFCLKPLEIFMMNAADSVACQTLLYLLLWFHIISMSIICWMYWSGWMWVMKWLVKWLNVLNNLLNVLNVNWQQWWNHHAHMGSNYDEINCHKNLPRQLTAWRTTWQNYLQWRNEDHVASIYDESGAHVTSIYDKSGAHVAPIRDETFHH